MSVVNSDVTSNNYMLWVINLPEVLMFGDFGNGFSSFELCTPHSQVKRVSYTAHKEC